MLTFANELFNRKKPRTPLIKQVVFNPAIKRHSL